MNRIYIDEELITLNGVPTTLYKVHGEHCSVQFFTTYYEAERYIRMITGYYGVDENRHTWQRWTFDSKGHLVKD